jgi:CelD/BcsL family acetyltransferase involved in cellulose biosynthesis
MESNGLFFNTRYSINKRIKIYNLFTSELEQIWKPFELIASGTPFQSYAWLSHWQSTVGSPLLSIQPQIVVVRNEKETLGVFPLGIRQVFGVFILEWLGGTQIDYTGPLLSKKWNYTMYELSDCWSDIINNLCKFDVIHFQKQKEYFKLIRNPFISSMNCSSNVKAYQVNLKSTWVDHYEKTVKTKLRADSRRQRRRLSAFGKLNFKVPKDKKNKYKIIRKMIQQKSRRYRETGVWDMLSVPEHKAFYEELANIENDNLQIHCSALYVGEIKVATHVGLVDKSTFYYLMPAHEGGDWERYSPGRLLLEHLLEWSIQNKLTIFDFTVGGEQYKKNWCDIETPLYETLCAITCKGKIFVMAKLVKRHLVQHLC